MTHRAARQASLPADSHSKTHRLQRSRISIADFRLFFFMTLDSPGSDYGLSLRKSCIDFCKVDIRETEIENASRNDG